MSTFEIEIDGKAIPAEEGQMVIDAADEAGIYIPRFCYHKKLSIAANCRMCLVEVEKSGKPLPACATPATSGMKVLTQSKKAIDAQRSVMEFLLINHPLDCPICDQGGECELQDLALGYGNDVGRYTEGKRSVEDEDIGPLVATEMTRCIHCTRCVRFGTEVAGLRELGATNRGENMRISTFVKHAMQSELSGNIIDLCPVGALTSKPYRFTARAWEMRQHPSIAAHDCVGSNIYVHTRFYEYSDYREVMRVVPRDNEALNECWLSDRDRFSYQGLASEKRHAGPMLKQNGKWLQVEWSTALNVVLDRLQAIKRTAGADEIAALIHPSSTIEEHYLLQKFMRLLGSNHVDHRLQQMDFSQQEAMPTYPNLGCRLQDIENMSAILVIGGDVRRQQPLLNNRIRKAELNGANIFSINALDYDVNYPLQQQWVVSTHEMVVTLAALVKALAKHANQTLPNAINQLVNDVEPDELMMAAAKTFANAEQSFILLGDFANQHPDAAVLMALAQQLANMNNAVVGTTSLGANSAGAWLAGAVPHRGPAGQGLQQSGDHVHDMFKKPRSAYLLYGVEPEHDLATPIAATNALANADFVVSFQSFTSEHVSKYADVILPIAPFTESDGTFVNVCGDWQSFTAISQPYADNKPGWKVLRVLGNLFELPEFDYQCSREISDELRSIVENMEEDLEKTLTVSPVHGHEKDTLICIREWPSYCVDAITRRADALQETLGEQAATFGISSYLATQLGVNEGDLVLASQGEKELCLPVEIDDRLNEYDVRVPAGLKATAGFGDAFTEIKLQRGKSRD